MSRGQCRPSETRAPEKTEPLRSPLGGHVAGRAAPAATFCVSICTLVPVKLQTEYPLLDVLAQRSPRNLRRLAAPSVSVFVLLYRKSHQIEYLETLQSPLLRLRHPLFHDVLWHLFAARELPASTFCVSICTFVPPSASESILLYPYMCCTPRHQVAARELHASASASGQCLYFRAPKLTLTLLEVPEQALSLLRELRLARIDTRTKVQILTQKGTKVQIRTQKYLSKRSASCADFGSRGSMPPSPGGSLQKGFSN